MDTRNWSAGFKKTTGSALRAGLFAAVALTAWHASADEVALPDGFKQLEWIEATGTQWIDTQIIGCNSLSVSMRMMNRNIGQGATDLLASVGNNCSAYVVSFRGVTGEQQKMGYGWGTGSDTGRELHQDWLMDQDVAYDVQLNLTQSSRTLSVNGEDVRSETAKKITCDTKRNLYLFSRNNDGAVLPSACCQARLWSLTMTGKDAKTGTTVTRTFVPCRNAEGEAGLYDTVSQTFFKNKGTGSFGCSDSHSQPVFLSWIESSGTQWIDTKFQHDATTVADLDVLFPSLPAREASGTALWRAYFGARTAALATDCFGGWITLPKTGSTLYHYRSVSSDEAAVTTLPVAANVRYAVHLVKNGECTVNGSTLATGSGGSASLNDYLFACNTAGAAGFHSIVRMYGCTITTNGVPARKFKPYRMIGGRLGLYDEVTGQFFGNSGDTSTGVFTWGGIAYTTEGTTICAHEGQLTAADLDGYEAVEKVSSASLDATAMTAFPVPLRISSGTFSLADGEAKEIPVAGELLLKGNAVLEIDITPDGADSLTADSVVLDDSLSAENPLFVTIQATGVARVAEDVPFVKGGSFVEADAEKFVVKGGFPAVVAVADGNLVLRAKAVAEAVWTGEADDGKWSTPGNWADSELPQNGAPILFSTPDGGTVDCDLQDYVAKTLMFGADAGSFTFTGGLTLGVSSSLTNDSAAAQTFSLPMELGVPGLPFLVHAVGDLTLTGSAKTSLSDEIVKTGTGTFTVNDDTVAAVRTVRVEAGTLKLANTGNTTEASTAGEIRIRDGACLDVNVSAGGAASLAYTEVTHGKTVYAEGTGPDGKGAIVNSSVQDGWGCTFGHLVLTDDASASGAGILSVRPLPGSRIPGSQMEGPGTFSINGPGQFNFHTTAFELGGIVVEDGGYLQFEGSATGTVTNGVTLADGSYVRLLNGPAFPAGIPFTVPTGASARLVTSGASATVNGKLRVDGELMATNVENNASTKIAGTLAGGGTLRGSTFVFSGAANRWEMKADDSGFTEKVNIDERIIPDVLVELRRIDVTYTGSTATPKTLPIGPAGNLTQYLVDENLTLDVVDGDGSPVPNCWLAINGENMLELHVADPNVVMTATWTGLGRAGDPTDPANWACSNSVGQLQGVLPSAVSRVTISGAAAQNCPTGVAFAYGSLTFAGAVLAADTDWSGLDFSRVTAGSSIDLHGNDLTLVLAANTTRALTITDSSAVGEGGTLRFVVPAGVTAQNGHISLTGSLTFVADGEGTYVPNFASGLTYSGKTVVSNGTMKAVYGQYAQTESIEIGPDGEFDIVGAGTVKRNSAYPEKTYVLSGGTLANRAAAASWDWGCLGTVRLAEDSFVNADKSIGFTAGGYAATMLDLAGHELSIDIGKNMMFWMCNTTVTAGKLTATGDSGSQIVFGRGSDKYPMTMTALETEFDLNCVMSIQDNATVSNLTLRSATAITRRAGKILTVCGRFTPILQANATGVKMAGGSTLDLSQATFTAPVSGLAFASGTTVTVDLGSRRFANRTKVVSWTAKPNVKFAGANGAGFVSDDDGLYYMKGFSIILR